VGRLTRASSCLPSAGERALTLVSCCVCSERALREVQALAALSGSNHIVRYFDAWIEDDLLYIQLENLEGCSLAGFVNQYAPHKVPEETLCKLLCHLAQVRGRGSPGPLEQVH
jgi:serine/threonine protein kinase